MRIETYQQLMCILRERPRIEVIAHQNPAHVGEIRRVTILQEASFYSVIDGHPEHPVSRRHYGKGTDTWLGHTSYVSFKDSVCTVRNIDEVRDHKEKPADFISFRVLEDS